MNKFHPLSVLLLYVLIRQYFLARREGRPIHAKSVLTMIPLSLFIIMGNFFSFSKLSTLVTPLMLLVGMPILYYFKNIYLVRRGRLQPDNKINMEISRKFALEVGIVFILLLMIKTIWS